MPAIVIGRHTAYNLVGLGVPLAAAVFTIPVLIGSLGQARFGLLTLIWAVVSYFGLFDLGLGRALTQRLSVAWGRDPTAGVGADVGTGLLLMVGLGILAALAVFVAAPSMVDLIRDVPDRTEAIVSLHAMALAMPAIVLTSGLRGILEARRAFGIVNAIRLPMGLFTFLGPWAVVAFFGPRLDWIAWTLCFGRVAGCLAHAWLAWRELPPRLRAGSPRFALVGPLCASGGWLTVSNVISPLMGYADRFVIGAVVSAAAVAVYATPHEVVTKLWVLPGALTATLFPAFAAQVATRGPELRPLFGRAVHGLLSAMLPITVLLALFAHELLSLWIGREFADLGAPLMQIFAVGILVNSAAHVPFTLIQSAGQARLTALIHLIELPLFLLLLWWLTRAYGLQGAAASWLVRMLVDTTAMFWVCMRLMGWSGAAVANLGNAGFAALCIAGFAGMLIESAALRALWCIAVLAVATLGVLRWRSAALRRSTLAASESSTPRLDLP